MAGRWGTPRAGNRVLALGTALVSLLPLCACVSAGGGREALGTGPLEVNVEVFDPLGRPERGPGGGIPSSAVPVLGASRFPEGAAEPGDRGLRQDPGLLQESPYARFGSNIVVHTDGRITKFYYITQETGLVLLSMLRPPPPPPDPTQPLPAHAYGYYQTIGGAVREEEPRGILERLLSGHPIEVEVIGNWDRITPLQEVREFPGLPRASLPTTVNDLLMVTADAEGLEKFEQTLNLLYAQVPQVEIEAKVVEFSYSEGLELGVSPVDPDTPTIRTRKEGSFVKSLLSRFPTATATGAIQPSKGLLTIGGVHDNLELNAVLELLQTRAKADVVSHPRIAVRNSGIALIETTSKLPFPRATIKGTSVETSIDFRDAGVKLSIRPVIAGTETVILNIHAEVSAVTGFAATDPVPTPIISTRSATTSVHVPSGRSIVIGGLISQSEFENESKVPILGDIPFLGYLFRSSSIQSNKSEVLFSITARIIQGYGAARPDLLFPLTGG